MDWVVSHWSDHGIFNEAGGIGVGRCCFAFGAFFSQEAIANRLPIGLLCDSASVQFAYRARARRQSFADESLADTLRIKCELQPSCLGVVMPFSATGR